MAPLKNFANALLFLLSITFLSLITSACVTTQSTKAPSLQQKTWRETGMMAYRDKQQNFVASYVWQNTPKESHIHLLGPLGVWRAELTMQLHHVELALSDGRRFTSTQPEKLMQQYLGWSIPVKELHYWLWGMVDPNVPAKIKRNSAGELVQIQQKDWLVNITAYQNFNGYHLPSRLLVQRADVKVTIVTQGFSG